MPEKIIKTTPPENDPVKRPNHYCYGRFECIEVIKEVTAGAPGPEGFLLGNVIKYLWRYRRKNGAEDLRKARRYIDMLLRMYEEMDGTRADAAILDVAPAAWEDGRPIYNTATAEAAARYIGEIGEFFDAATGKRTRGRLVKIAADSLAPFLGRVSVSFNPNDLVARSGVIPYKFFSPLPKNGADAAILDPAPGAVPIRNNRPVFSETTTWAAARLTGQSGEFFDGDGTRRTRGMLVRIDNGLPAPYIARILLKEPGPGGIPRYVTMPYKHFSPLPPEPENGRPVFNRVVAEGAARYIGKEGEFFDKPGGTRKRGVLRLITGPACDFRFNAGLEEGGVGIFAFFSPLNPELQETGAEENPQEKPDA